MRDSPAVVAQQLQKRGRKAAAGEENASLAEIAAFVEPPAKRNSGRPVAVAEVLAAVTVVAAATSGATFAVPATVAAAPDAARKRKQSAPPGTAGRIARAKKLADAAAAVALAVAASAALEADANDADADGEEDGEEDDDENGGDEFANEGGHGDDARPGATAVAECAQCTHPVQTLPRLGTDMFALK